MGVMTETKPAPGRNLAAFIRQTLETEIEAGQFAPGTSLDERALALRFNVSRTPVREALQQLAAVDLVRIASRNGVFVKRLSVSQLRSMFELLAELEAVCAKLAARRLDDRHRAVLVESFQACEEAAQVLDYDEYRRANAAFHEALYSASHNQYIAEQVRNIRKSTKRYRINDLHSQRQIIESLEGHRRIMAAVLAADPAAAYTAMLDHVPIGTTGFSEFLSTLPPGVLEEA